VKIVLYRPIEGTIKTLTGPAVFNREVGGKAEDTGFHVILVNPRNTSQQCSRCGMIVAKTLSDQVHSCPHCGLVMDRDQNAAINIMRLGLQSQG